MQHANRHALRGPFRRLVEHYEMDDVFSVSGELRFTRKEAIEELKCANWIALAKLAKMLRRLKIKTARQLFLADPKDLIDTKGIGVTTLYVAMCVLDHHGYRVAEWWGWEKERPRKRVGEVEAAMKEARA
jgi:hypothetical protein